MTQVMYIALVSVLWGIDDGPL